MTSAPAQPSASSESPFVDGLNERQREAVLHERGPLVVLAGPGAGKTHTIVRRLARLVAPVEDGGAGAPPESVVALAYTVKAADELRERVEEIVGSLTAGAMFIGTSHSFGRRIVKRFGDAIGLPWKHHIADSAERIGLLRELARETDMAASQAAGGLDSALRSAMEFISACHTDAIDPDKAQQWIETRQQRLVENPESLGEEDLAAAKAALEIDRERVAMYALFEKARIERGMLSLDDYLLLPIRILRDCERPRDILRAECKHVVVDEFQDWNPAQIQMLRLLCPASSGGTGGPNVCVVGDDDQSIYAFRGADDRAFERFTSHWPGHATVALEVNYRSEAPIVEAGNAIIERAESRFAPEKRVRAHAAENPDPTARVEGVFASDDGDLGPIIAAMIRVDHEESGRALGDYAVLARTHTEADRCAAALELEGLGVNRRVRHTPLEDQAVRDLLAWCGALTDATRTHDVQRILVRPPVGAAIESVQEWTGTYRRAARERDARSLLQWLREEQGEHEAVGRLFHLLDQLLPRCATQTADVAMHDIIRTVDLAHAEAVDGRNRAMRIENLIAVLRFVRARVDYLDPPGNLEAFLRHYEDLDAREQAFEHAGDGRVDGGDEEHDERADGVVVLTAHSAKGLEFDTVFLPRVRSPYGYPMNRGSRDDGTLLDDPELTGRNPTSPMDEERRLFYVAATRAKRRLVLLAKKRKAKRGKNVDFFDELTQDAMPEQIAIADGDDWLARAARTRPDAADLHDEASPVMGLEAWLHEQMTLQRQRASALVLDASRPEHDADAVRAIGEQLGASAQRLAILARAQATGALPPFADETDPFVGLVRERLEGQGSGPAIVRPMMAPLTLSYSKITEYQGCPRCFYVKYVLGLDEAKTSALSTGSVVHEAIERFLNEHRLAESEGEALPDRARLLDIGARIFRQSIPPSRPPADGALERVNDLLERFFDSFHDPDAELLIIEGEDADAGEPDSERGRVAPFPYRTASAPDLEHRIIAKPDRVERMSNGAFRIVDYKTGRASKGLLEPKKDDLQLAIYAMAVQRHFELDEPPAGLAEYWLLSTGERGVVDMREIRYDKVHEKIDKAIDGMLTGAFDRGADRACKGLCDLLRFDGTTSLGGGDA